MLLLWGEGIIKLLEVYFILINIGVRNRPCGVFGVDLKNYTVLKSVHLCLIWKRWAV